MDHRGLTLKCRSIWLFKLRDLTLEMSFFAKIYTVIVYRDLIPWSNRWVLFPVMNSWIFLWRSPWGVSGARPPSARAAAAVVGRPPFRARRLHASFSALSFQVTQCARRLRGKLHFKFEQSGAIFYSVRAP